jgi:hypothetical protein
VLAQTLKLSDLDFGEFDDDNDAELDKMPTLIQHGATQVRFHRVPLSVADPGFESVQLLDPGGENSRIRDKNIPVGNTLVPQLYFGRLNCLSFVLYQNNSL